METTRLATVDCPAPAKGTDALPRKPLASQKRTSMFSRLAHPCVLSTPDEREQILKTAADPVWQRFVEEATIIFQDTPLPAPKFPIFCHDGDLDRIMGMSVLAYVKLERRYFEPLAGWLRAIIRYFNDHRAEWDLHLQQLTFGKSAAEVDPRQKGNPRQFFDGFGIPGFYWVEGGLSLCILHLYDLIEAYAPDMLEESEKRQLEEALTHFAERFAFHEEALKYNNRAGYANLGMLIAALTRQDPLAAKVLLHRARRRNDELRATFLDEGSYAEGSHAYHNLAADALALFAHLHKNAFPAARDLFLAYSGEESLDSYPSIEGMMDALVKTVIPAATPRENPRGVGAHVSHAPISVRAALVLAYRQDQNPRIGWLLASSRGRVREEYQSPLKVTNAAVLDLGSYVPLDNFWLERTPYRIQEPEPGLALLPELGEAFSRSGGHGPDSSMVWTHYGYHGSAKGQRDNGHVGLSVGGHELLADPFPREGPIGRDSSMFHNTVTSGRAETPITTGKLLDSRSISEADACLVMNHGGKPPRRYFLHDPRDEALYVFNIEPTDHPPFTLRRAIAHWHRRALVLIDDVVMTEDAAGPIDWFFYMRGQPGNYQPDAAVHSEEYMIRSILRGQLSRNINIDVRGHSCDIPASGTFEADYASTPHTLHMIALPQTGPITLEHGHIDEPGRRNLDGSTASASATYFTRARSTARRCKMIWIFTWDGQRPTVHTTSHMDRTCVMLQLGNETFEIHCDLATSKIEISNDAKMAI